MKNDIATIDDQRRADRKIAGGDAQGRGVVDPPASRGWPSWARDRNPAGIRSSHLRSHLQRDVLGRYQLEEGGVEFVMGPSFPSSPPRCAGGPPRCAGGPTLFVTLFAASARVYARAAVQHVVIHRAGGYAQLELEQAPRRGLGPGEVRILVHACGVNYADCIVRMGLYKSAKKYVGWPITPGFEVAGTIVQVGEGVTGLRLGEDVFAVTRFGGYTSELVVSEAQVFPRPPGFTMAEAAAFPSVHLTAHYALTELAAARKGQTLLVHSAAGGVGSVLVRLGRYFGCHVVGVVGAAHKVGHVRSLGANAVIDKSTEPLWERAASLAPDGYDAVFDANGVATLRESYRHVAPTGRLVVYGFATMLPRAGRRVSWIRLAFDWLRTPRFDPLALTNDNRSVMGFNLSYLFEHPTLLHASMDQLLALVDEGVLPPPAVTRYRLEDVASAHRDLERGQTIGKLVLEPRPPGDSDVGPEDAGDGDVGPGDG